MESNSGLKINIIDGIKWIKSDRIIFCGVWVE